LGVKKAWITLSQPGAERLAQQMRDAGYVSLVEPATAIKFLPWAPPVQLPDRLIFLSQHAALGFLQESKSLSVASQCEFVAAIGERSAAVLRGSGVRVVVPDLEQSEGLLDMPELVPLADGGLLRTTDRVWQIGGKGGRNLIADALADKCCWERCDVYERIDVNLDHVDIADIGALVVGSIHGLEQVAAHWHACGGAQSAIVIVPSERVAARAQQLGFSRCFNSHGTDGRSIINTIKTALV
jgi:uroporphyrinogen-III synthase|tara:strand:+ start:369 stop:1091 length:723 start_codon:yes stop_codon:yes gene_type:complete